MQAHVPVKRAIERVRAEQISPAQAALEDAEILARWNAEKIPCMSDPVQYLGSRNVFNDRALTAERRDCPISAYCAVK